MALRKIDSTLGEWWRLDKAWFLKDGTKGNIAQVHRTGSRFKITAWSWWAYGVGRGEASTMADAMNAAENAILRGVAR